jgi:hypothetical protein
MSALSEVGGCLEKRDLHPSDILRQYQSAVTDALGELGIDDHDWPNEMEYVLEEGIDMLKEERRALERSFESSSQDWDRYDGPSSSEPLDLGRELFSDVDE